MPASGGLLLQIRVGSLLDQYQAWLTGAAVFAAVLVGTYLVGRLLVLPPLMRILRARNPNNPTLVDAIGLYLQVLFVVVGIPLAITAAGFGGIAAGSGIVVAAATLALGVAGQDVIGNLVSGAFLVGDPDFNIGDYIEWADRSGTVEQIDLRVTRLRTPSGEIVVVPNTELTTSAVSRPFARDRYRVSERLTVAYTEDLDEVTDLLVGAASDDDRVLATPEPTVHVTALGDSAIELSAWFWVGDPTSVNLAAVRTAFRTRAKDALLEAGIAVAPATPQELSGRLTVERPDPPRDVPPGA